jgi:hypothetical protein
LLIFLEKHELLSGVDPFSTMGAFKVSFQEFNNFKTNEKPEKAEEKIGLEAHYSNLQTMVSTFLEVFYTYIIKSRKKVILVVLYFFW